MTTEIEIESFLYSCGAKNKKIKKAFYYHYYYDFNNRKIILIKFPQGYIIEIPNGEGIHVSMWDKRVTYEFGEINTIAFPWPTDKAALCQILSVLTSTKMCKGLTKKECHAFKRFLVASLLE